VPGYRTISTDLRARYDFRLHIFVEPFNLILQVFISQINVM
jgi:hypothetical protein